MTLTKVCPECVADMDLDSDQWNCPACGQRMNVMPWDQDIIDSMNGDDVDA